VVDEANEVAIVFSLSTAKNLDKLSLLLNDKETIDRESYEALLSGEDPAEVFKARMRLVPVRPRESKRLHRQRRSREQDELEPEGRERVATCGVAPVASHGDQA
jgi:hypothetical protein